MTHAKEKHRGVQAVQAPERRPLAQPVGQLVTLHNRSRIGPNGHEGVRGATAPNGARHMAEAPDDTTHAPRRGEPGIIGCAPPRTHRQANYRTLSDRSKRTPPMARYKAAKDREPYNHSRHHRRPRHQAGPHRRAPARPPRIGQQLCRRDPPRHRLSLTSRQSGATATNSGRCTRRACRSTVKRADPCQHLPVGPVEDPVEIRRHKGGLLRGDPS
jgi:hypothetical protein